MEASPGAVTRLLRDWRQGDEDAFRELIPVVFHELRRLAQYHLSREAPGHTLQPTALVNEVYLRLMGGTAEIEDRTHFFAFAARLMREILVDHARARQAAKRGGGAVKVSLDEAVGVASHQGLDVATVLAVDAALSRLEQLDERQGRVVELRTFSGLTLPEIAEVVGVSLATVERDWSVARRWLARELSRA